MICVKLVVMSKSAGATDRTVNVSSKTSELLGADPDWPVSCGSSMLMGMSDDGDGLGEGAALAASADITTKPVATTAVLIRPRINRVKFIDEPSAR